MASTPEKKVKLAVTRLLDARGVYYFSPVTGGFGRSGVPDIIACFKSKFLAIECKAGDNKPTALQLKHIANIQKSQGCAIVVNEHNLEDLVYVLDFIDGENK